MMGALAEAPARVQFHDWCLDAADKSERILSLRSVTARLYPRFTVLKMDIEGFEWPVIAQWRPDDVFLPDSLLLEIHVATFSSEQAQWVRSLDWVDRTKSYGQVLLLMLHLQQLGYILVHQENRPGGCGHCIELTLFLLQ